MVKPSFGLDPQTVRQLIEESQKVAAEEMELRLLIQTKIEAKQMIQSVIFAIKHDGHLLSAEELIEIQSKMKLLEQLLAFDNKAALLSAIREIEAISSIFAYKRMDVLFNSAVNT